MIQNIIMVGRGLTNPAVIERFSDQDIPKYNDTIRYKDHGDGV